LALVIVWLAQGDQLELSRATFQRLALLSALPGFLAVLVLAAGLREVRRQAPAAGKPILGSLRAMPPAFRRFVAVFALFMLGNSADAFIVLRAQERGLSVAGVLVMLLAYNLLYTLVAGPAGVLSDRIGRPRLILAGWIVYAVIYLGLALAATASQVMALFVAYGLYYGLVEGNARAFVADLAGSEARGSAYGLYHAVVGLTVLPASVIAGVLWQGIGRWGGFGPSAPFLFGALMAGLATVLLVTWALPARGEPVT
jgi:MFS family permease